MIQIRPTKKNLKGILDDPEFFRKDYKLRKQKGNVILPTALKKFVMLLEGGMDELDAIVEVYPKLRVKPKTALLQKKKKYPYLIKAIELAKETFEENTWRVKMSDKETTIGSRTHEAFDANESLHNWREMFKLAKEQKNLNAMISIQANIDKIVNAQEQYDIANRKDKQVFTKDISEARDDSWKDELGPIMKMFEDRGLTFPGIPETKTKEKIKLNKDGRPRKPRWTKGMKREEGIRDLNPLQSMIFPL